MKKLMAVLLIFFSFCACSDASKINDKTTESTEQVQENMMITMHTAEKSDNIITVKVGDKTFSAQLYDNETAHAFADMLPITLDMHELNGNEKYCYLSNSLPMDSSDIGKIKIGDIILYGSHCIVLFYDSFSTNYSYTKIGYIENPTGLADAVGSGNVTVSFEK